MPKAIAPKNPISPSDSEMQAFEEALLRGIDETQAGQYARVSTPHTIVARRAGRPLGSAQAVVKSPTTLRLDHAVLERWRASGKGWQTRAAHVLATHAPAA